MSPDELAEYEASLQRSHASRVEIVESLDIAPSENLESNIRQDALAEAIFLDAFTSYESDLERFFLHYVTGGASRSGQVCVSYLRTDDEALARKIAKAGQRFLSWAKPSHTKETAQTYLENGWPLAEMMATRESILSDCERTRNRIAHNSIEATQQFLTAQRNIFGTERAFLVRPGQFLRMRKPNSKKLIVTIYVNAMRDVIEALLDPPR